MLRDRKNSAPNFTVLNLTPECRYGARASQALERVINLFPQDLHKQLLLDLSLNIRSVISQRLVMGIDAKRCAAVEVMLSTPHLADLVLKGELGQIKEAIESADLRYGSVQSIQSQAH
jgi:twitching motility protein PilU